MRRSCCYAPDILEMLQADLVMLFFSNIVLDMLVFFWVQICSFFCDQNGERPIYTLISNDEKRNFFVEGRGRTTVNAIVRVSI